MMYLSSYQDTNSVIFYGKSAWITQPNEKTMNISTKQTIIISTKKLSSFQLNIMPT